MTERNEIIEWINEAPDSVERARRKRQVYAMLYGTHQPLRSTGSSRPPYRRSSALAHVESVAASAYQALRGAALRVVQAARGRLATGR